MSEALAVTNDQHKRIDQLERAMLKELPLVECPLLHQFTPGLYLRAIFNPAGSLITTRIHAVEHQFILMQGRASIFIPGEETIHIEAPYVGITKAGTRRVIYAHTDIIWLTCHPNPDDCRNVEELEDRLTVRREWPEDGKTAFEHYTEQIARQLEGQGSKALISGGEA